MTRGAGRSLIKTVRENWGVSLSDPAPSCRGLCALAVTPRYCLRKGTQRYFPVPQAVTQGPQEALWAHHPGSEH